MPYKRSIPQGKEAEAAFEMIDRHLLHDYDIRKETDPKKRQERIEEVVYGMIAFGSEDPAVAKALMAAWLVRNNMPVTV